MAFTDQPPNYHIQSMLPQLESLATFRQEAEDSIVKRMMPPSKEKILEILNPHLSHTSKHAQLSVQPPFILETHTEEAENLAKMMAQSPLASEKSGALLPCISLSYLEVGHMVKVEPHTEW